MRNFHRFVCGGVKDFSTLIYFYFLSSLFRYLYFTIHIFKITYFTTFLNKMMHFYSMHCPWHPKVIFNA
jgi:hypothetical protein